MLRTLFLTGSADHRGYMQTLTGQKRNEIRWNDLDFGDDPTLLSHIQQQIQKRITHNDSG
ncbi:hypothetical protein DPMN_166643 [Dreissena polymorpha]|uniref:Uncharacterized protein n=1 Tax=Dreissena polymorpha TaxID=45954 RepID=A0A9D4EX92_DREPO|nr:hypothetical protein DPMN_166643 [Dreissena polymorpha]